MSATLTTLRIEQPQPHVKLITLNREDVANAMNTQMGCDLLACFDAMATAYTARIAWEPAAALEARAAHLLPGRFLARVDGKSPVEYVTDEQDKDRVRRTARSLLFDPVERLGDVKRAWVKELAV